MTIFLYKAKDGTRTVTGEMEAGSENQCLAMLEAKGYLPVHVETAPVHQRGPVLKVRGISSREINTFTRQLASLIKSRVQLVKALDILQRETPSVRLKEILSDLKDEIKNGRQLSEALAKYPKYFSSVYINMIASGEKGGILESILLRLVDFADKQEEIKSKLRAALAYPLLMLVVGIVTVMVMIVMVVPKMIKLYADMGQNLPLATRILIAVSKFSSHYWYWLILFVFLVALGIKNSGLIEKKRVSLDRIILSLPLLGGYILTREIARFCRTLGLLIGNGIPIREALEATVPTLGNSSLEQELKAVRNDLASGLSVAKSFARIPFLPGFMVSLIGVAEEAGRLEEGLFEVAASYEKQLDEQIKVMSSLIEPILILGLGLVVGFIVVAMLLPIFQISLH